MLKNNKVSKRNEDDVDKYVAVEDYEVDSVFLGPYFTGMFFPGSVAGIILA